MSSENNKRMLLSVGFFFISIVVAVLLYIAGVITDWVLMVPIIFLLNGIWFFALGAIRLSKPVKYERSPFGTVAIGLIAVAVGGAWFLWSINWLYSLIMILLVIAALAIVAALQRK
jgi:hypothetical protein